MEYKKLPINGYKVLNMYPVYVDSLYDGHEPLKIVGIRENEVELEGDYSGGTHSITQKQWYKDNEVFVVSTVCDEDLKPNGCQVHNVNCCGGGSVISKHVNYWEDKPNEIKPKEPQPTEEEILFMVDSFVENLDVSNSVKMATSFGYQEGLYRMLEIWKESEKKEL